MIARPLAEHFRRLLGPAGVIDDPAAMAPYGVDRTTRYRPAPGLVVRPATVEEVAAVVRLARAEGLPLVPSGGRTGYAGGAVAAAGEVVVSLERMRRIAHFSPQDAAVTCEAGVVTAELQAFAERQNLFYPVDLASAGSCQIGGNAATNAGGVHVIRYGGTREQVTGLTVVTGTGEVLRLNRGLVKNNAGPDLRHLFVGSEGILGILCEVTVRLAPPRPPQWVLLAAAPDVEALLAFAAAARRALVLSACEFFSEAALQRVRARSGLAHPFARPAPLYGLLEFDAPPDGGEVEELFAAARSNGWLEDAVLATEPGPGAPAVAACGKRSPRPWPPRGPSSSTSPCASSAWPSWAGA
ncbi:MAG: hypothetical protein KatS3mg124_2174 [Porticoccaceae bacterium]|nr:MAG: hypothetical protein KatS3mg124_2174 [Porticoccaceae bacterium]